MKSRNTRNRNMKKLLSGCMLAPTVLTSCVQNSCVEAGKNQFKDNVIGGIVSFFGNLLSHAFSFSGKVLSKLMSGIYNLIADALREQKELESAARQKISFKGGNKNLGENMDPNVNLMVEDSKNSSKKEDDVININAVGNEESKKDKDRQQKIVDKSIKNPEESNKLKNFLQNIENKRKSYLSEAMKKPRENAEKQKKEKKIANEENFNLFEYNENDKGEKSSKKIVDINKIHNDDYEENFNLFEYNENDNVEDINKIIERKKRELEKKISEHHKILNRDDDKEVPPGAFILENEIKKLKNEIGDLKQKAANPTKLSRKEVKNLVAKNFEETGVQIGTDDESSEYANNIGIFKSKFDGINVSENVVKQVNEFAKSLITYRGLKGLQSGEIPYLNYIREEVKMLNDREKYAEDLNYAYKELLKEYPEKIYKQFAKITNSLQKQISEDDKLCELLHSSLRIMPSKNNRVDYHSLAESALKILKLIDDEKNINPECKRYLNRVAIDLVKEVFLEGVCEELVCEELDVDKSGADVRVKNLASKVILFNNILSNLCGAKLVSEEFVKSFTHPIYDFVEGSCNTKDYNSFVGLVKDEKTELSISDENTLSEFFIKFVDGKFDNINDINEIDDNINNINNINNYNINDINNYK